EIGEVKGDSGGFYGEAVHGIQTKKPHTGFVSIGHIGADIKLWQSRYIGQWRDSPCADIAHMKRHNGNPCFTLVGFQRQACWNQRLERFWWERPMRKEQIQPALRHCPESWRAFPRAMILL